MRVACDVVVRRLRSFVVRCSPRMPAAALPTLTEVKSQVDALDAKVVALDA